MNILNLKELKKLYKERPKTKFLWSGIKEKSFGLVFGPSKSGKTIFCENLAFKLAIGAKEFFGYPLDGIPKKVLFLGLEEFWEQRIERNLLQIQELKDDELNLAETNYLFQPIDFERRISSKENWEKLEALIIKSKADVVFIDSITRMNPGKIENSETAEFIMQKLREISYDNEITLICIHHTPKMYDTNITMDKIKGSSVFAQESDFAFGINRTSKGHRYLKEIFFRYMSDDFEDVEEFEIDQNTNINSIGRCDEDTILKRTDRRSGNKKDYVESMLNDNANTTYRTEELVYILTKDLNIKERQAKTYLQQLVKEDKIFQPQRGLYKGKFND